MFTESLDKKPVFTRPDGIEIKDLTASMFDKTANNSVKYSIYKVPAEFEMRPDLISAVVYNNSVYAELILKFNGISNPFSIKQGDIILIPALESMSTLMAKPTGTDSDGANTIRNSYKYIDPLKLPKTDTKFANRQIVGGATSQSLPPNIAQEGETQIAYRSGRVYFGEGSNTCLQNGMTSSEYLAAAIKSNNTNK